jgi:hypothetical protein
MVVRRSIWRVEILLSFSGGAVIEERDWKPKPIE